MKGFGVMTSKPRPSTTTSSTAALSGTDLVFGTAGSVDDVNALTGRLEWRYSEGDSNAVDSSPAIVGPPGSQVVAQ